MWQEEEWLKNCGISEGALVNRCKITWSGLYSDEAEGVPFISYCHKTLNWLKTWWIFKSHYHRHTQIDPMFSLLKLLESVCWGGTGMVWAGKVVLRTGCPDNTSAICLYPSALQSCPFDELSIPSSWSPFSLLGYKRKAKSLSVFRQISLWVLFQITFRERNAICFLSLTSPTMLSLDHRWHCSVKFQPCRRIFHIFNFTDWKKQRPLQSSKPWFQ